VRRIRRRRLLAHGGAADYKDPQVFAAVDSVLRRAVEGRDQEALLISELVGGADEWRLASHLRFSSHPPLLRTAIVFLKRRVLLPATRWLFEYSQENFRRQDRLNRVLLTCIEELAIENAKLRSASQAQDGPPEGKRA